MQPKFGFTRQHRVRVDSAVLSHWKAGAMCFQLWGTVSWDQILPSAAAPVSRSATPLGPSTQVIPASPIGPGTIPDLRAPNPAVGAKPEPAAQGPVGDLVKMQKLFSYTHTHMHKHRNTLFLDSLGAPYPFSALFYRFIVLSGEAISLAPGVSKVMFFSLALFTILFTPLPPLLLL